MLVPEADLQVPAVRETDWLAHFLPVPSVNPTKAGEG